MSPEQAPDQGAPAPPQPAELPPQVAEGFAAAQAQFDELVPPTIEQEDIDKNKQLGVEVAHFIALGRDNPGLLNKAGHESHRRPLTVTQAYIKLAQYKAAFPNDEVKQAFNQISQRLGLDADDIKSRDDPDASPELIAEQLRLMNRLHSEISEAVEDNTKGIAVGIGAAAAKTVASREASKAQERKEPGEESGSGLIEPEPITTDSRRRESIDALLDEELPRPHTKRDKKELREAHKKWVEGGQQGPEPHLPAEDKNFPHRATHRRDRKFTNRAQEVIWKRDRTRMKRYENQALRGAPPGTSMPLHPRQDTESRREENIEKFRTPDALDQHPDVIYLFRGGQWGHDKARKSVIDGRKNRTSDAGTVKQLDRLTDSRDSYTPQERRKEMRAFRLDRVYAKHDMEYEQEINDLRRGHKKGIIRRIPTAVRRKIELTGLFNVGVLPGAQFSRNPEALKRSITHDYGERYLIEPQVRE